MGSVMENHDDHHLRLRDWLCELLSSFQADVSESDEVSPELGGRYLRLERQTKAMVQRFPKYKNDLSCRWSVVRQEWQRLKLRCEDVTECNSTGCFRFWLKVTEKKLQRIEDERIDWSCREDLLRKFEELKGLQTEVEQHGRTLITSLNAPHHSNNTNHHSVANGHHSAMGNGHSVMDSKRYQNVSILEKRWHTLWLRSLEQQCLVEQQLRDGDGKDILGLRRVDTDTGPSVKRARLAGQNGAVGFLHQNGVSEDESDVSEAENQPEVQENGWYPDLENAGNLDPQLSPLTPRGAPEPENGLECLIPPPPPAARSAGGSEPGHDAPSLSPGTTVIAPLTSSPSHHFYTMTIDTLLDGEGEGAPGPPPDQGELPGMPFPPLGGLFAEGLTSTPIASGVTGGRRSYAASLVGTQDGKLTTAGGCNIIPAPAEMTDSLTANLSDGDSSFALNTTPAPLFATAQPGHNSNIMSTTSHHNLNDDQEANLSGEESDLVDCMTLSNFEHQLDNVSSSTSPSLVLTPSETQWSPLRKVSSHGSSARQGRERDTMETSFEEAVLSIGPSGSPILMMTHPPSGEASTNPPYKIRRRRRYSFSSASGVPPNGGGNPPGFPMSQSLHSDCSAVSTNLHGSGSSSYYRSLSELYQMNLVPAVERYCDRQGPVPLSRIGRRRARLIGGNPAKGIGRLPRSLSDSEQLAWHHKFLWHNETGPSTHGVPSGKKPAPSHGLFAPQPSPEPAEDQGDSTDEDADGNGEAGRRGGRWSRARVTSGQQGSPRGTRMDADGDSGASSEAGVYEWDDYRPPDHSEAGGPIEKPLDGSALLEEDYQHELAPGVRMPPIGVSRGDSASDSNRGSPPSTARTVVSLFSSDSLHLTQATAAPEPELASPTKEDNTRQQSRLSTLRWTIFTISFLLVSLVSGLIILFMSLGDRFVKFDNCYRAESWLHASFHALCTWTTDYVSGPPPV